MENEAIDLVIVDGLLPDTDGVSWIAAARERGWKMPIVFMSAFWRDMRTFLRLTEELGVARVFRKPIVPEQFVAQIDELMHPSESAGPSEMLACLGTEYRRSMPDKVNQICLAVERARRHPDAGSARAGARDLAHRLRGAAGTYGLPRISELAGEIEDVLEGEGPIGASLEHALLSESLGAEQPQREAG